MANVELEETKKKFEKVKIELDEKRKSRKSLIIENQEYQSNLEAMEDKLVKFNTKIQELRQDRDNYKGALEISEKNLNNAKMQWENDKFNFENKIEDLQD